MNSSALAKDYFIEKRQIAKRLHTNWEAIFKKYDRPHKNDAVIDLSALEIVQNKDVIAQMPRKHVGHTAFASNKRGRKKKSTKDSGSEYERIDLALGSMATDISLSTIYPELNSLDFTNADPDETGVGCIRYQYDKKNDKEPQLSGPKELLGDAAKPDISGAEDEDDTSSVISGPIVSDESLGSSGLQSSMTVSSFDSTDNEDKGNVVKQCKTNPEQKSDRGNEEFSNIVGVESSGESGFHSDETSPRTLGSTSILEAKENFVQKVYRFLNHAEGEGGGGMVCESNECTVENDTATTSCSDLGGSHVTDQPEVDMPKTSASSVSVSQVPENDKDNKETMPKPAEMCKSDKQPNSRDFNEYSTILAGNLGMDMSIDNIDGTEDERHKCGENKTTSSSNHPLCLNRTLGGGLKLPPQGTAKHIVIGSVPLNTDVQDQKVDQQGTCQSEVRNNLLFFTPKSKLHSKSGAVKASHKPRTPKSGTCRLNTAELLEVFKSPLPMTPKWTQVESTLIKGVQLQSHPSPTSFKSTFEVDSVATRIANEVCSSWKQASANHLNTVRPSPLPKPLKTMQEEAEEEAEQVMARSPRHKAPVSDADIDHVRKKMPMINNDHRKELKLPSLSTPIHKDITDGNHAQKQPNHASNKTIHKKQSQLLSTGGQSEAVLGMCSAKQSNKTRLVEQSHLANHCIVASKRPSSIVKEKQVDRLRGKTNSNDIPSVVSPLRQSKRPEKETSDEDLERDLTSDDASHSVKSPSCLTSPMNYLSLRSPSNSVQGSQSEKGLERTPTSSKRRNTRALFTNLNNVAGQKMDTQKKKDSKIGAHNKCTIKPSSLAKALKKMQNQAKEEERVMVKSPRHNALVSDRVIVPARKKLSTNKNDQMNKDLKSPFLSTPIQGDITDGNQTQKQSNLVQLSATSESNDDIGKQHDTYEFQTSMTWCDIDTANNKTANKKESRLLSTDGQSEGLSDVSSAKQPNKSMSVEQSQNTNHCIVASNKPSSIVKEKQVDRLRGKTKSNDIPSVVSPVRQSKRPEKETSNEDLERDLSLVDASHSLKSPSCLTSPMNYLSLRSPSNSVLGSQSEKGLERTPTSSKRKQTRVLFAHSSCGAELKMDKQKKKVSEMAAQNKCTFRTKNNIAQLSKLQRKCVSPSKEVIMIKLKERSDQRIKRSATRKIPSSPRRNPWQPEKQDKAVLVTSTPIKNKKHQEYLEGVLVKSNHETTPVRSSKTRGLSKSPLNNTSMAQKRHSPEIQRQRGNRKMNNTDLSISESSRLLKKCGRNLGSRKPSQVTSDTDDCLFSSSSDSCSVTLTSSDTFFENSSLITSMSSSSVSCAGPGQCTKMFCFTCAVSELN